MKIGIIVHSQTGNTFTVAQKLQDKLSTAGHSVNIERIAPAGGEQRDAKNIRFDKLPDLSAYDALVLGAPVQAFSVSPVMAAYLKQLPSLQGKKIACFVTKGLPFYWTGGNRAISQMKKACESRGGTVGATGIVIWKKTGVEKNIEDVVEKLSGSF
ncbi:flavodoxin [Methanocella sp. CWC-04]|uniref:Flavodoxin n=1 Tax=Methanooceanicella nereidis TaxID=2052831 RepID=A0AAP2W6G2_9EURY|nr:flavodoxin domain-containing protein [Methanocella sp. CWC-04]MCD1294071.1 flavodoxin [Methanocella sp. CWC-04]